MKLVILAGQSNVVGRGKADELPEAFAKPPEQVRLFEKGAWKALTAGSSVGPEVGAGFALAAAWPQREIGLLKVAAGGTSLLDWWPDGAPRPEGAAPQKGKGLYAKLLAEFGAATKDRPFELVAFFWGQGLGDAKDGLGPTREKNITLFIGRLRKDLGKPDLPFVFSQMPQVLESKHPDVKLIRAGNEAIARNVAGTALFPTDGLELWPDGVHYTTAGQLQYGARMAEALLKAVGPAAPGK
ncbi:MAG: hypothetical protein HS116_17825 [Planctomycetes bacterium]|nr:hypothetical protein [Planctomycetota bacterium]